MHSVVRGKDILLDGKTKFEFRLKMGRKSCVSRCFCMYRDKHHPTFCVKCRWVLPYLAGEDEVLTY